MLQSHHFTSALFPFPHVQLNVGPGNSNVTSLLKTQQI